jgi:hypothetical protein
MMQKKAVKINTPDLLVEGIVEVSEAVAPYVADIRFIKIKFLGRWLDITNTVLMDADACRSMQALLIEEYSRAAVSI